jgi:hypothetical protein
VVALNVKAEEEKKKIFQIRIFRIEPSPLKSIAIAA